MQERETEGAASSNGSSSKSIQRDLSEQAAQAFSVLQRRADRDTSPEQITSFLLQKNVTRQTIFDALADYGRAQGLMVGTRRIDRADLQDERLSGDLLLLPDGNIGLVERVDRKAESLRMRNFGTRARESYDFDRLMASHDGSIPVLHLQGRVPRFLSEDDRSSPLRSDTFFEAAGDPHDNLNNIPETFQGLLRFLGDERKDIITITLYAVMVALFSLTIPLVSQGIIDAVSMGTFTNQIVVLCGVIAVGLLLYGAFNILQHYTVDMVQRRLFAATGLEMAYRIPLMKREALEGEYGPPLINRFFDVITMQKSLSKLLLNGLEYVLVALVSLILLAVYHPFFLIIGLLALLFTPLLVWGLGRNGVPTSIKESSAKYAMAHWLEDLARCHQSFKLSSSPTYVHNRADWLASSYVRRRGRHFRVFLRQLGGTVIFRAFIVALALGIGGLLTTRGSITLGQFVAAELVIVSLTNSIFNLVELFESGYDLLAAISKILHVTEKPLEPIGGEEMPQNTGPAALSLQNVRVGYSDKMVLDGISLEVKAGSHVCIIGEGGSGKSTLARTLLRLHPLKQGRLSIDGYDTGRLDLRSYRRAIGIAPPDDELFRGTIEENITMGRIFDYQALDQALHMARLHEDVLTMPNGLDTMITSAGLELPKGLARRIMIARAVIGEPRVLVLDEALGGVRDSVRQVIAERIYGHDAWTIISVVDDDPTTLQWADRVIVLGEGRLSWSGAPQALVDGAEGFPEERYPQLIASLRAQRHEPA